MSDQKIRADNWHSEPIQSFLPDPNEIPRTILRSVCFLAYATLLGFVAGHVGVGFVVGIGAACGLAGHQIAARGDWLLRSKVPRR